MNLELKELFQICSICNGTGQIDIGTHDCWGKPESIIVPCRTCGGNKFVVKPGLVRQIKDTLGL